MPKNNSGSVPGNGPGNEPNSVSGKVGATILLLLVVVFSNAFVTSSFPQNILINEDTTFNFHGNLLSFQEVNEQGATIILNANQESVNNRDVIAMGGRNSIRLTGNQVSVGENDFFTGQVTIPTRLNHIILFEQSTLELKDDLKIIDINFREHQITLENEFEDIYLINDGSNTYNIELPVGDLTYITDDENDVLFKVQHIEDKIKIALVGYYPAEEFTVTTKEEIII